MLGGGVQTTNDTSALEFTKKHRSMEIFSRRHLITQK